MSPRPDPDVLVLGEVLVEVSSLEPARHGGAARLGFSGDALNVAAAAAAAGATVALVARIPDDDLGDALIARIGELGVDTSAIVRGEGQHGVYLSHADPAGERHFAYARAGSFGSTLCPDDLDLDLVRRSGVVTASGVAVAISRTAADTVLAAARAARRFVYDPNFRPRLTTAADAVQALRAVAPHAAVLKPSHPAETALLGAPAGADDAQALAAAHALGASAVVLTRGSRGALVSENGQVTEVPVVPAPALVDQTGAGDSLTGTMCARLALGDDLVTAVRLGSAAASLCLGGQGGTGFVPTLDQTRAHLAGASPSTIGARS